MDTIPHSPPGRGNQPEPSREEAHETMERERARRHCCSVETKIEAAVRKAESCALAVWDRGKDHIREYPVESVSLAAATGYFWTRLPMGALLATGARVFAAFAPPTLVALGICAVVEKLRHQDEEWRKRRVPPVPPDAGPPFPPPAAVDGL